jgi:hypothetical protein
MTGNYFVSLNSYLIEVFSMRYELRLKKSMLSCFLSLSAHLNRKEVSTCVVTTVTSDYYRLVTRQITADDYRLTAIIIDWYQLLSNIKWL